MRSRIPDHEQNRPARIGFRWQERFGKESELVGACSPENFFDQWLRGEKAWPSLFETFPVARFWVQSCELKDGLLDSETLREEAEDRVD